MPDYFDYYVADMSLAEYARALHNGKGRQLDDDQLTALIYGTHRRVEERVQAAEKRVRIARRDVKHAENEGARWQDAAVSLLTPAQREVYDTLFWDMGAFQAFEVAVRA